MYAGAGKLKPERQTLARGEGRFPQYEAFFVCRKVQYLAPDASVLVGSIATVPQYQEYQEYLLVFWVRVCGRGVFAME